MSDGDAPRFVIVGGGPAGSLLANYLGKAGIRADVYEMRDDPRIAGVTRGRSINLALSYRGLSAMAPVGLVDKIMSMSVPMRGRMIHSVDGTTAFQSYGVNDRQAINSVSRGQLNAVLLAAAEEYPSVRLFFNEKCSQINLEKGEVTFVNTQSGNSRLVGGAIVAAADGAFSMVRRAMQRLERFDFSQEYLSHGYKELTISAGPGGSYALEKHALHIWPRKSFMMIALPNFDGSFTCTLFWPFEGVNSFAAITSKDELQGFFRQWFPDALPSMPQLEEEYFANPTGSMVTIKCAPWSYGDRVVMFGDACHAVVPFYGQGMNAAFEDVMVFEECRKEGAGNWGATFREYERARKTSTDCLAALAVKNFVEMRDRTGSQGFRIQKKVEKTLAKVFKHWYIPLYVMVTFTRIPYATALQRSRRQNRFVGAAAILVLVTVISIALWLIRRGGQ